MKKKKRRIERKEQKEKSQKTKKEEPERSIGYYNQLRTKGLGIFWSLEVGVIFGGGGGFFFRDFKANILVT